MNNSVDHQSELENQRLDYARRLPETVSEICDTWHTLCDGGWDEEAFSGLSTVVHKLAGTAKNYGYDELGGVALLLDRAFKERDQNGVPAKAEKEQIESWLDEISQLADKSPDTSATSHLPQTKVSGEKGLVYIVDDDEDASRYFEVILKSAGYTTETFSVLMEFHRALQKKMPDIIIMDIVFPEGDFAGVDAINRLETELGENIPIVFVSARSDVHARIRALRAGGCAYVTKPVEPEALLSVVASISNVEQAHKRVLVIDDDPLVLIHLKTLMQNFHYDVLSLVDPMETLDAIDSFIPDVVVMDYNMPDYNGEELIKVLRQDQRYINLPIIMVTGDTDPEVEKRVTRLLNTSFLTKPINNDLFIKTLSDSIEVAYRSKKIMLDLLKQHPHGLLNLYYFYSELESIIASAESRDQQYTLIYLAIDDTNEISERMGFKRLVSLNKKISSYLVTLIEKQELISQLTGFVYLILVKAENQAVLAENINLLKTKIECEVFTVDDIGITITASIGATSISSGINSVDEAVGIAERASINASKSGGNQTCIEFPEQVGNKGLDSEIGRIFKEAFDNKGLHLQYQPIININTSGSVYEGFARFVVGERKMTPELFMPYIKEYKLEFEFNKKVIITAINDIIRSADISQDKETAVIVVKLEPTKKTMKEFLKWFEEYLSSNQIEINNKLIFSFRENWVLKNHDAFQAFAKRARKYDCSLALEHAGLSKYTVDLVETIKPLFAKLSPKFTERLLSSETGKSHEILQNLLATETCVVASSVENADVFAKLMMLGIYNFQGYILQQPGAGLDFSVSQLDI